MLGLYLHIPFCQAICSYCNFNRGLLDADLKARYVDALEAEILRAGDGRMADTIFFGGGTPSLLHPDEIARLIEACRGAFALTPDAEITLETNPETVDADRLDAFHRAGVTRLSFGVQSFDDDELKRLGRIHSADRAARSIEAAKSVDFESVSFDLMLWLPGQSAASWARTIDRAITLAPDHLSLYLLELYPNAPLKEAMARSGWSQAPDDDAADMYLDGLARLDEAGYVQYEISNVARCDARGAGRRGATSAAGSATVVRKERVLPSHHSRHNVKYWQGGSWWGFGCGAHSTVDGIRWRDVSATSEYVERVGRGESPVVDRQALSTQTQREEALFLGLRLSTGIDGRNFVDHFGVDPWTIYGERLADALDAGLLWREDGRFGLTRRGMLLANEILTIFV